MIPVNKATFDRRSNPGWLQYNHALCPAIILSAAKGVVISVAALERQTRTDLWKGHRQRERPGSEADSELTRWRNMRTNFLNGSNRERIHPLAHRVLARFSCR
jgi:hypothetical protein